VQDPDRKLAAYLNACGHAVHADVSELMADDAMAALVDKCVALD
jgi:hypothetical protein